MEDCTRFSITGNVLDTNTVAGFNCLQGQSGCVNGVVSGNVFRNVQRGIYFETGTITDILITGNVVEGGIATSGTPDGITVVGGSRITITNNTIKETERHGILISNCGNVLVANNNISPNSAQALQGVGICGVYTASNNDISIVGNVINGGFESADTSANSGSGAIALEASGFTLTRVLVKGNVAQTLTNIATERGIRLVTGTFASTIVEGNFTPGIIETSAAAITLNNRAGRVIPTNAFGQVIGFDSSAPASGTHFVGEVQLHSAPASGGNIGWVCTTGGTPGTWKTFGAIA